MGRNRNKRRNDDDPAAVRSRALAKQGAPADTAPDDDEDDDEGIPDLPDNVIPPGGAGAGRSDDERAARRAAAEKKLREMMGGMSPEKVAQLQAVMGGGTNPAMLLVRMAPRWTKLLLLAAVAGILAAFGLGVYGVFFAPGAGIDWGWIGWGALAGITSVAAIGLAIRGMIVGAVRNMQQTFLGGMGDPTGKKR